MINVEGKYGTAIIYHDFVEDSAIEQVKELMDQPMSKDAHVRIMSDIHSGAGCVIGYTAKLTDYVVPNLIGVDINCGMLAVRLEYTPHLTESDLAFMDSIAKQTIPTGWYKHDKAVVRLDADYYSQLLEVCSHTKQNIDDVVCSIGTLGSGNHFLEVDIADDNTVWLVIHTGSRNFGLKVANYHQNIAKNNRNKELVAELKTQYTGEELGEKIRAIPKKTKGLEFLVGEERLQYLKDMKVASKYADINRHTIANELLKAWGIKSDYRFTTVHNYIDMEQGIVRKGAISAMDEEIVLIPFNMRDGSVIAVGKGNSEWNYSAPHGAGRIMSRSKAKEILTVDDFEQSMKGIYSSSVGKSTLDEAPMAYKDFNEILRYIKDTVDIKHRLLPVWNFKDSSK